MCLLLALMLALSFAAQVQAVDPERLFPFVLPWDDAAPGATSVADWLAKPAGKLGPVHAGPDGHFYTGEQRIRFFGVNFCFAANFPSKDEAPRIAARLAKFGINVVRFHHMDMFAYPQGIRARNQAGTGALDPEALDRLDYFLAQLKSQGIYANLNLLVSRPFNQADGVPADIERLEWKDRHAIGFFYKPLLQPQQDYARNLLSHRNPYTKLTLAEDPAVAFVEINNENGLIHAWLGRQLEAMPEAFARDLQRQWNAWLRRQYPTTDQLKKAWKTLDESLRAELLSNLQFTRGLEGWLLEHHDQAEATAVASDDLPASLRSGSPAPKSARIDVTRASSAGWHVQFNQSALQLESAHPYTVIFSAKADQPRRVQVQVGQAHEPWQSLGLDAEVALTREWRQFRFVFLPTASDKRARLNISNLGQQQGTVWLAEPSLRRGGALGLGPEERLESGTVTLIARAGASTMAAQRDWLRFLWETEDAYWTTMRGFLSDELHVRAVVVGTIVGCSTPNLMSRFSAIDSHAYWQHPQFPHRPWDADDWTLANRTMANELGGTLPGLAFRRVLGKPHCVSEYNHAAPNTFSSEGFLLLAAYSALQDFDAIYAFAYGHGGERETRHFAGFFDIDQHPTKMATLPSAVALFVRGDVQPAHRQVVARLSRDEEIDRLQHSWAWELVHAGHMGIPRETALVHRIALATEGVPIPEQPPGTDVHAGMRRYISDTGELAWDLSMRGRGVVTVDTTKSKAVIGYAGGRRFDLGGVRIEPSTTRQEGWCTITLTVRAGRLGDGPTSLLVTATGTAENTAMRWKNDAHDSVGRHWGQAPSLVEGIHAALTLPVPTERVRVWALDERGQRRDEIPVTAAGTRARLEIGPKWRTLWYEVEVK
jgi:hypothetical protein